MPAGVVEILEPGLDHMKAQMGPSDRFYVYQVTDTRHDSRFCVYQVNDTLVRILLSVPITSHDSN